MVRPTKAKRKAILKAARTSKKLKFMDDPLIAEQVQAVELRDKWLVERGRAPPETKARMKKAADAEKKLANKQAKAQENAKNKTKAQVLDLMRLATANRRAEEIGSFKNILSDPVDGNESLDNITPTPTLPAIPLSEKSQRANSVCQTNQQTKKSTLQSRVGRLRRSGPRAPTPPLPVQMELIRAGSKRKVQVTQKALENTPSKRMRMATD